MPLPSSHTAIKAKHMQKQKKAHHTPGDAGEDLPIEATGGRASTLLDQNSKEWVGEMGWREGGAPTHFPSEKFFHLICPWKAEQKMALHLTHLFFFFY